MNVIYLELTHIFGRSPVASLNSFSNAFASDLG